MTFEHSFQAQPALFIRFVAVLTLGIHILPFRTRSLHNLVLFPDFISHERPESGRELRLATSRTVVQCACQIGTKVRRSNSTNAIPKTITADGTALRSFQLSLPTLNELADRDSSDTRWGAKRRARPGIGVW